MSRSVQVMYNVAYNVSNDRQSELHIIIWLTMITKKTHTEILSRI